MSTPDQHPHGPRFNPWRFFPSLRSLLLTLALALGTFGVASQGINAYIAARGRMSADDIIGFRTSLLIGFFVLVAIICLVVAWAAHAITGPLRRTLRFIDRVAEGDFTGRLQVETNDEVGQMAAALNKALDAFSVTLSEIDECAARLREAAGDLTGVSDTLDSQSKETSEGIGRTSEAMSAVTANVHSVAAAVEQMSSSVQEIARNASAAAEVATSGVAEVGTIETTAAKLIASSAEISNVVKLISSIAEQTNLLALNATIEAARAGDAGKGFAVVAGEVKELAQETGRATADISARVAAIQADSNDVVEAINRVGLTIREVHDRQSSIAAAVEEQVATTNELGRSAQDAASSGVEVATGVSVVSGVAQSTHVSAERASALAADLGRFAERLRTAAGRFRH